MWILSRPAICDQNKINSQAILKAEKHRCVKRKISLPRLYVGDNEPATDGCRGGGGCLGLGRTVGITVTAKKQGKGEELNLFV